MKYICKIKEPEVLKELKTQTNEDWKPTYKHDLKGEKRQSVHNDLIAEQGYICCYCGQRIVQSNSHIEHFKPQAKYRDFELDYFNLLASCQNELKPKEPRHCGMGKDDWFDEKLMVSPLLPDCEDFFEYSIGGEILSTCEVKKTAAAKKTIERLKLNIPKLQATRAAAIASLYDEPDFISKLSDNEIERLIDGYSQIDENGQYQSYCQVLIYILKQEKRMR